jgi:uncharacterized protein (TIGR00369 family)
MATMKAMVEQFAAAGVDLRLPPESNKTLGTEYTDFEPGKMIAARVRFEERYTNPLRLYQGGFLCAVLDEVYGPLTYIAAGRPAVTIEMSTSFVRPFTAKDEFVHVRAELVSQSKTLLVLRAEARNPAGKLIATSTSHSLIVQDQALNRGR